MSECQCDRCQNARIAAAMDGQPIDQVVRLLSASIDYAEGTASPKYGEQPVTEPRERLIRIRGLLEKALRAAQHIQFETRDNLSTQA